MNETKKCQSNVIDLRNKKKEDGLCYVVTKMDYNDNPLGEKSITLYLDKTSQLADVLLKLSGFSNIPNYKIGPMINGEMGYILNEKGEKILNKQKSNRKGILDWDDLGIKDKEGRLKKLRVMATYSREDVLEFYLLVENVDLCVEYDVDMIGKMS